MIERIQELWAWHIMNDKFYVSLNGVSHIEEMISNAKEEEGVEDWEELSEPILKEFLAYLEESHQEKISNLRET